MGVAADWRGSRMNCGSFEVIKFARRFWAFDDNGGFGGPYESLLSGIGELPMCFHGVDVFVKVTGVPSADMPK